MVKESSKTIIILSTLSMATAAVALLSTVKPMVIGVAFPLMLAALALMIENKPRVNAVIEVNPGRIYVNEDVEVSVRVKVTGGYGIITIRAPPRPGSTEAEGFELVDGKNVHIVFKGFRDVEKTFKYRLRAVRRGRYELSTLDYTYHDLLGLTTPIEGHVDVSASVEVMPRVKLITKATGIIKPREAFPRTPLSRLGPYSTEFRSVREYVLGDPYRFINWKATARSPNGNLMVNEYEREGLRTILVVLDSARWMRYGTWEENPLEYGILLILSLSRLLLRYNYNVGLWTTMGRVYPSSGMGHYYKIQRALMGIEAKPAAYINDPALRVMVNETRPLVIMVTSVNNDNVNWLSGFLRSLPTYGILLDIIPHSIIMKMSLPDIKCAKALALDRVRLYGLMPSRFRILAWDPVCDGIGPITVKVLSNIGWSV
jgi:uncharacterized protein (DUF58 family)